MGSDIHAYPEVYTDKTSPWSWRRGDEKRWRLAVPFKEYDEECDEEYLIIPRGCDAGYFRNYDVFAQLGDVRNGVGFAGVDTGSGFIPMETAGNGIPSDVSEPVAREYERWGPDAHSATHFTLEQLLAYRDEVAKEEITEHRGVVSALTYYTYLKNGRPRGSVCGDISGSDIRKVSNKEMNELLGKYDLSEFFEEDKKTGEIVIEEERKKRSELPEELKGVYTKIGWQQTYYESTKWFWDSFPGWLQWIGHNWYVDDPSKVRIVAWYDN